MVDILAIGAHPDDIELGCSGTIIKHIQKGQKVAVIDLTEGELGSRGSVEIRYKEAAAAAALMQLTDRINLQFQDGFFRNDEAHQLQLIAAIRHYKPRIVLANAYHDRHPDHGRASQLIEDACFLSGLRKIQTSYQGKYQVAHRPARVLHYIQDRYIKPDIVVDISEQMEQKLAAIHCYSTQFTSNEGDGEPMTYISTPDFIENIKSRAREYGKSISVQYGEGFCCKAAIGIQDLDQIHFGNLV